MSSLHEFPADYILRFFPPSTFHHVITIYMSVAWGFHSHNSESIAATVLTEYHTTLGGSIVTNTNHADVRFEILRIGIHQLQTFLEVPETERSHHILNLTEARGLLAMVHLAAFGV